MPKEIKDIREFLTIARKSSSKLIKIKKNKSTGIFKLKVRAADYLYTFACPDKKKVEKIRQALPPGLKVELIKPLK
ncbi:60S large subunit ribosomal protein eL38 (rpL38) [Andalucia godoyi]|uniref:60S large subunit ribosomal protein eL38 (RpL38) n=1 Tax=Andalucia godoyi TaxID=505711 RepID=A0A8K0AFZ1_ANDGO|nr:60S large subunit ribosomal protein eL38 (rpL38) [Andalucia godoyi]|eukprot:ANDGO_01231.mRNA.1 60S large subunit ribosomal protein eL38 (rpL38)